MKDNYNLEDDYYENYIPKHASNSFEIKNNYFWEKDSSKLIVKKKKKRLKKIILVFFIIISLIFIIYSLLRMIFWKRDNDNTNNVLDMFNDVVIKEDNDEDAEIKSVDDDKNSLYWKYIDVPFLDVDITELRKVNKDAVGWINVRNTNINYPFVQTTDNEYYLNHSFDRSKNKAGWLFLDYRNNSNLNNRNNIIYAHNRINDTMFGTLDNTLKEDWYKDINNHVIRISLENENTVWQIFSVYTIKVENYYNSTYFDNDSEYLKFLNTIKNRSIYDFKTELNKDDRILTLSTCHKGNERTVVHAKLIKSSYK